MKIIHIADLGKSGKINGVGESVLNLARHQRAVGENVKVIYTRPNQAIDKTIAKEIIRYKDFRVIISKFRPEIVIFHSFYDFKHPVFARFLNRMNIPYLITFHGGVSKNNYQRKHLIKWLVNNLIFKRYIKNAKATIYLNNNEQANSIFYNLTKNNSLILPNGVNLPTTTHNYNSNGITISFISRLDYVGKGIDLLLLAINKIFDKLQQEKVKIKFYGYHYGDGTIEKISQLFPICEYCGYVEDRDKRAAFLGTDILILPSRSEGMPVSVLEALSYGIPSIVTPQTNVADIIQSNGCGWVTNLDAEELAKTILISISEIKTNSMILKRNCLNTSQQFGWSSIAIKSISQYKSILEKYL